VVYFKAVLLAIVEGITEFLPISSTGHLILVEDFLQLSQDTDFCHQFAVIIQLPAIISVVIYFWKDLSPIGATPERRRDLYKLWFNTLVAVAPAMVLGYFAYDYLADNLFSPVPVALALFVGGVVLILVERIDHKVSIESVMDITVRMALAIGMFQCLAMIPGVSRSAATIIGAMLLGASRPAAAEFSFFLAIPTMLAATGYSLMKSGFYFTVEQSLVLILGSAVSFIVAYAVIAGFMHYIRNRSFAVFGYYRVALALIVIAAWQLGWMAVGD